MKHFFLISLISFICLSANADDVNFKVFENLKNMPVFTSTQNNISYYTQYNQASFTSCDKKVLIMSSYSMDVFMNPIKAVLRFEIDLRDIKSVLPALGDRPALGLLAKSKSIKWDVLAVAKDPDLLMKLLLDNTALKYLRSLGLLDNRSKSSYENIAEIVFEDTKTRDQYLKEILELVGYCQKIE